MTLELTRCTMCKQEYNPGDADHGHVWIQVCDEDPDAIEGDLCMPCMARLLEFLVANTQPNIVGLKGEPT